MSDTDTTFDVTHTTSPSRSVSIPRATTASASTGTRSVPSPIIGVCNSCTSISTPSATVSRILVRFPATARHTFKQRRLSLPAAEMRRPLKTLVLDRVPPLSDQLAQECKEPQGFPVPLRLF